jgi:hypothetical protein
MTPLVFMRKTACLFLTLTAIVTFAGCATKDMALSNQGFEELSKGNDLEAAMKLEEALTINPDNPYALLNMGVVYHRMGRPEKARRMYEKVMALQPKETAESSNVPSFSGRSLAEIAEANLKLLEDGAPGIPTGVSEPVPAPLAVMPSQGQRPGLQEEIPKQDDTPTLPQKGEAAGESKPELEETVYRVRESQTLFEIAGRHDVYGDVLKWPTLFRINMGKFQSTEDLLSKPIQKGTRLRMVTRDQASKRAAMMVEKLWVVNVTSVRTPDKTVPPAIALMKKGYHVYLIKTDLAGEQWIKLRVGFYPNILEAMAVCEEIRPLTGSSGEPCVSRIDEEEFEKNAGY